MIKTIKKIMVIILLISITINTINPVYAKSTVSYGTVVQETETKPPGPTSPGDLKKYTDSNSNGTRTYTCDYGDRWIADQNKRIVGVYDENNVDVIRNNFEMDENDYPLAGTAVGLSIKEYRYRIIALYKVIVTVEGTEKKTRTVKDYYCKYETKRRQLLPDGSNEKFFIHRLDSDNYPKCRVTEKKTNSATECPAPDIYCKKSEGPYYKARQEEYYETYSAKYEFDFENEKTSVVANDNRDAQYIKKCLDDAASYVRSGGNYSSYTNASYNVYLTNSNDFNASQQIELNKNTAQKTSKNYNIAGEKLDVKNCKTVNNGVCMFNYQESSISGNKVSAGRFYIQESDPINRTNPYLAYSIVSYDYHTDKTCINRQTGKINYILESTSNCNPNTDFVIENETLTVDETIGFKEGHGIAHSVEIKNIDEIQWHYFIPLNTKSNQGIKIRFQDTGSEPLSVAACINALKEYPIIQNDSNSSLQKYTELIKTKGNEVFVGDAYCLDKCGTRDAILNTHSIDYDRIISDGGCVRAGENTIYVKQQFYNESTKNASGKTKINFNGFNFYYRPLNINDPFPNGTGTNSLWKEWNAKTNNNPNLSESYKEVTYVARNINSNEIRAYTENNPYTSWNNMNVNGTSQYIGNGQDSVIQRIKSGDTYKLGCGPANENEYLNDARTIKNPLYIKGCGKS